MSIEGILPAELSHLDKGLPGRDVELRDTRLDWLTGALDERLLLGEAGRDFPCRILYFPDISHFVGRSGRIQS